MLYIKQTVDGNIRIDNNIGVVRMGYIAPLCMVINEVDKALVYEELSEYQKARFNKNYVVTTKLESTLCDTVMEIIGRGRQ